MYMASPEYMATYGAPLILAGAKVVGGCCGTTPAAHPRPGGLGVRPLAPRQPREGAGADGGRRRATHATVRQSAGGGRLSRVQPMPRRSAAPGTDGGAPPQPAGVGARVASLRRTLAVGGQARGRASS